MELISGLKAMYMFRVFTLLFCCCGVVFLAQPTTAQQKWDYSCTLLDLLYPSYVVSGRSPIPLSVEVLGAKEVLGEEMAKRLTYEWTLSQGQIASGQGTPRILVRPNEIRGVADILVNMRLIGGHPACETEKSFSIKIDSECIPDEKAHLDNIAAKLAADPTSIVYILTYAGRASCFWEAQSRAARAKQYLIKQHEIQEPRIITADNGYRENLTVELFIAPRGSCGPLPTPTVPTSEIRLEGSCQEKYQKRNEPIEP